MQEKEHARASGGPAIEVASVIRMIKIEKLRANSNKKMGDRQAAKAVRSFDAYI